MNASLTKTALTAAALTLSAGALGSHPHAFVTTTMSFDMNEAQQITGVTMTWEYDDFFSLLIFEDMGLDRDADGKLTQTELDRLMGFDLEVWPEGFEGDLFLTSNGKKIEMPRPTPHDIGVNNGKIRATQKRAIPAVPADGLVIQQYDPTYYVAYDLSGGIDVPAPCAVRIQAADADAAESELARLIEEQSQTEDIYMNVDLGYLYADEIILSCE